jgi:hypothetical protein
MGKFRDFVKHLRSIKEEDMIEGLRQIIKRRDAIILDLNRSQLMSGVDSEGKRLDEYKSEWYRKFKATLNPKRVTDLRLEGNFHENFFMVGELPIIIWSYDDKTDELVAKYGRKIFGLTEENKDRLLIAYLKKDYQKFFRELIRLQ